MKTVLNNDVDLWLSLDSFISPNKYRLSNIPSIYDARSPQEMIELYNLSGFSSRLFLENAPPVVFRLHSLPVCF